MWSDSLSDRFWTSSGSAEELVSFRLASVLHMKCHKVRCWPCDTQLRSVYEMRQLPCLLCPNNPARFTGGVA